MADNQENKTFFDSVAANSPLGGISTNLGISSSLSQNLEEQAAKALASLAKSREFGEGIGEELSREVRKQLEEAINKLGGTVNAQVIDRLSDVAKATSAVLPIVATNKGELDEKTIEKIIRSAVQVQGIVGYENLTEVLTRRVFPQVLADSPVRQYRAEDAGDVITMEGARTAFNRRPMETARQFIYGQLPSEYLLYGGPAITAIGSPLRKEFERSRKTTQTVEELDLGKGVQEFFETEANIKAKKLNEYLTALNTQFTIITDELEEALKENDSKKAAELRRTLSALGSEIIETEKTLSEAEEEAEETRKAGLGDLYAATAPIGRHAAGALRNPIPSLIRESIKVAMDTSAAISSILGGMEGDNVVELGTLLAVGGTVAAAGAASSLVGKGVGKLSPEVGKAMEEVPLTPGWGGFGTRFVVGQSPYMRRQRTNELPADIDNIGGLSEVPSEAITSTNIKDYSGYLQKEGLDSIYNKQELVAEQFDNLAKSTEDLSTNISMVNDGLIRFGGFIGGGLTTAGLLYAGMNAPGGGELLQPAISMTAGALAGFLNFGLGAIDIGQGHLLDYWSATTGLNINQFMDLAGGNRSVSGFLGQSVLGSDALRMGFNITDITRGYEVLQRGMPTGELSAQGMRELLDENAKIARALGLRLEESIQFTTELRRVFGPGVQPEQMGGLIAGLGTDRFGNFESAFSKAVAQGFVEATRNLMMQGVAPESSVLGMGALRNVFLGPNQPDYLRTLVETNPQAITGLVSTFGGMLRQGAAGGNPWALGMGLRSGMTIEEMSRGGPESVMRMLDQLMQELPMGTMAPGGQLGRQGRDILAMFAAQQGLNPDLLIGYAQAYVRGDTERARAQFRAQFGRGAAWESGLTTPEVQRSALVEENLAVLQRTTARLSQTAEEFQDAITTVNTALLGLTDAALDGMESLYSGIKAFAGLMGIDEEQIVGESAGVRSRGVANVPKITIVDEEGKPIKREPTEAELRGEEAARKFREAGGVFPTINTRVVGAGNTQTIIKVDGLVQIEERPITGFDVESER